jgi:hypothetical protein
MRSLRASHGSARRLNCGVRRHIMRIALIAILLAGCAGGREAYVHATNICLAETQPSGLARIVPSPADVDAAAPLVQLQGKERIVYWFESPAGQIQLGVSERGSLHAGSQYRVIELARQSAQLSVVSEREALCIS